MQFFKKSNHRKIRGFDKKSFEKTTTIIKGLAIACLFALALMLGECLILAYSF